MSRLAVALWDGIRSVFKVLFWVAVAIFIAKIVFDKPGTDYQVAKPSPPLDLTKPVYTKANAILCPLSLFFVSHSDKDMRALVGLWTTVWNRSEKVKAAGCQEWIDGMPVRARKLFQDDDDVISIDGTFFTMRLDLRN